MLNTKFQASEPSGSEEEGSNSMVQTHNPLEQSYLTQRPSFAQTQSRTRIHSAIQGEMSFKEIVD